MSGPAQPSPCDNLGFVLTQSMTSGRASFNQTILSATPLNAETVSETTARAVQALKEIKYPNLRRIGLAIQYVVIPVTSVVVTYYALRYFHRIPQSKIVQLQNLQANLERVFAQLHPLNKAKHQDSYSQFIDRIQKLPQKKYSSSQCAEFEREILELVDQLRLTQIAQLTSEVSRLTTLVQQRDVQIDLMSHAACTTSSEELYLELNDKTEEIQRSNERVAELETELKQKDKQLAEKDEVIAKQAQQIKQLSSDLSVLKAQSQAMENFLKQQFPDSFPIE